MGEDSGRCGKTPTVPAIWVDRTQYNKSRHKENLDRMTNCTSAWKESQKLKMGERGWGGLTFSVRNGDWHQA